jgi:hypothetical protein
MAKRSSFHRAPNSKSKMTSLEQKKPAAESFFADEVPSPVGLNELIAIYDNLTLQLNQDAVAVNESRQENNYPLYNKLRLVCSLLLAANAVCTSEQRSALEATSRRAHLLQQCCEPNDEEPAPKVHATTISMHMIKWSVMAADHQSSSYNLILSIDKNELAAEEEFLLHMANTPIPTSDPTITTTLTATSACPHYADNANTVLQNLLRREWGDEIYERLLQQRCYT